MKKIFVIILSFCLFVSCVDKRAKTITFLFEPEQMSSIRDSLIKLRDIAEEYFNMQKKEDPYMSAITLTSRNNLWIDGVEFCRWSDLETNKDSVFHSNIELNLFYLDEKGFFALLKFLNDNFIAGIHYNPIGASSFPYCGEPFFRIRIHKYIVLKSEFYALPEAMRNFDLTYYLITDDKEGLLLLSDKGDVLLHVYGAWGDKMDKAPEKWRRPTDEIFYK